MSVTNHSIAVWVDGVDKTTSLKKDSLFVRLTLKHSSSCELTFINYTPPERSVVNVYVNSVLVFGGYIVRRSANIQGVKNQANVLWKCECVDWNELLNTVKITVDYTNQSDSFIINNLFTTYLSGQGFNSTSGIISQSSAVNISFVDVSLSEALEQLAKQVGANWFIQADKVLNWFNRDSGTAASFQISSSPNNVDKFGFINNSLSYDVDSSTIINQVKIIAGVTSNGQKLTEYFTGDGTKKTFNLTQIPNSVAYVGYNAASANYVTYGSFIGYEPQDKLISKGGSFLVVINQQQKTITIEGNTGAAPTNGSSITVEYYQKEVVTSEFNNELSQDLFGVYPISIEHKEFVSVDQATELANNILDQNAYGKASLRFETTKYGLLPGQRVTIDVSELEIVRGWAYSALSPEDDGYLYTEDYSVLISEQYALGKDFLVQEVALQPVVTAQNQFMIVCQVTCGKYLPDLIDALATVSELRSSRGIESQNPIPTRLSNISADLGVVQVGRAEFTNGGTARFNWGTPNAATGVVIGLEDRTGLEGAMYIYDQGTARVKLGKMNGLPTLGTVVPSGWGLYTENGYFSGVVAASKLIGGTVTGSLISGGTVIGNYITGGTVLGSYVTGGTVFGNLILGGTVQGGIVTGGTVTGSLVTGGTVSGNIISGGTITGTRVTGGSIVGNTIIGGTIATSTPPINSSNPGVYLDSTGLYGYGSAGLTFRLSSNPAIKPWFSSGTILNTVYEVNESAVIRTGTTNPRVQIDNSGIFAYNSAGILRFSVDSATGELAASNGNFQGNVFASILTGNLVQAGTITGNEIIGGTVTGGQIVGGTITSGVLNSGTINTSVFNASTFNTGTIIASVLNSGSVTSSYILSGYVGGNYIEGGTITGGVIQANYLTGNIVNAGTVQGAQITGNQINGGTVTGALVTGGTVSSASGNVYLDSVGLNMITASGYTYGDQRNIKWRTTTGGSILVEFAGSWNGGTAESWLQAGYPNSKYGINHTFAYGTSGNMVSEMVQYPNAFLWKMTTEPILKLEAGTIRTYGTIIPDSAVYDQTIGTNTNGFRYLYLKDDNGNVRRVSINSSGVLTVT